MKIHRKYRFGDLPDIQISNKSFIVPLAGACEHDDELASVVMATLVEAVIKSASTKPQVRIF